MDPYRQELESLRVRYETLAVRVRERDASIRERDLALAARDGEVKELRRVLERARPQPAWRRFVAPALRFGGALSIAALAAVLLQAAHAEQSELRARIAQLEDTLERSNARYRATLAEMDALRQQQRDVHGGALRAENEPGRLIATAIGGTCEFFVDGVRVGDGASSSVRTPAVRGAHTVGCKRPNGEQVTTTVMVAASGPALASFRLP